MELVGKAQLRKDALKHSNAPRTVEAWISVVEAAQWNDLIEVRKTYRSADYAKGRTIFNVKGLTGHNFNYDPLYLVRDKSKVYCLVQYIP
jgi:mRNA-degrading endonuclease HigB of HigAB toxin-antitoxin module